MAVNVCFRVRPRSTVVKALPAAESPICIKGSLDDFSRTSLGRIVAGTGLPLTAFDGMTGSPQPFYRLLARPCQKF